LRISFLLLTLSLAAGTAKVAGDEGMWTFDNPPVKRLQERYQFTPTKEWLDHLRLSSVRFNDGGSGSFVSATGLVLTNHHVARGQLQKISSEKKNYSADGFYARTRAQELKCPDLELNVLMSMENVTSRVQASTAKAQGAATLEARRAEIAKIEKESLDASGLRSDVVTLYGGGEYWLYRYKRYTDVRLVFAPEEQIAFFGGDPDNFTYPRYDLDMAIFRVYEDGKPVQSRDYLKWNPKGAAEGDLVFVSGHPGSTDRLDTVAELQTLRDLVLPFQLKIWKARVAALKRYGSSGPEQMRQAEDLIFGLENSIKAIEGEYAGLQHRATYGKKEKDEADFRTAAAKKSDVERQVTEALAEIEKAEGAYRDRFTQASYRTPSVSYARSTTLAMNIVRYVVETKKPDGERLPGYHEAQLPSLKLRMFSPAPLYPAMDEVLIADWLQDSLAALGADDPFMKAALAGQTPAGRAKALMTATTLGDANVRKQLVDGGDAAVTASTDPLIQFARAIDPFVREQQKWRDENVTSIETAASEKLATARFDLFGKSTYPDATFTLRLAYGTVASYPMNGTKAPPHTTMYGLYDRSYSFGNKPPFNLPARYVTRKAALNLQTPLNFVSTADIIGGNSGSPVVDRNGDLVGLIFDGNIESLVGAYVYNDATNRAVSVHVAAMLEALSKLYDAAALANELQGIAATPSPAVAPAAAGK
jgi:hypothetical protein